MDPNASLGPPSSGELWIQEAMRGPIGAPTVMGPAGAPTTVAVANVLDDKLNAMEKKFLQALTTVSGPSRKNKGDSNNRCQG